MFIKYTTQTTSWCVFSFLFFSFSIAKSASREAEKDYHFVISGSFSNYQGHTARFRVLGEIGDPLPKEM